MCESPWGMPLSNDWASLVVLVTGSGPYYSSLAELEIEKGTPGCRSPSPAARQRVAAIASFPGGAATAPEGLRSAGVWITSSTSSAPDVP
jgi:hypothetical protein